MKDFLENVGPALGRFHEVSGLINNKLPEYAEQVMIDERNRINDIVKKAFELEISDPDNVDIEQLTKDFIEGSHEGFCRKYPEMRETFERVLKRIATPDLLQLFQQSHVRTNILRTIADKDPSSLPAQLSKMMTESAFGEFSFKTSLLVTTVPVSLQPRYVESSVEQVALLDARAMTIEDDASSTESDDQPADSESADDLEEKKQEENLAPVAAEMSVLYEYTQTNEEPVIEDGQRKPEYRKQAYRLLAVAVFEGWLRGREDTRWKISELRSADEFPNHSSARKL
jgi:hypothetical protein